MQTNFKKDLNAESIIHEFLNDNFYPVFLKRDLSFKKYINKKDDYNFQIAGVDAILQRESLEGGIITTYFIDEKAAITECNSDLPTFCQEISHISKKVNNPIEVKGWFVDNKKTTHYLYCYITLTKEGLKKYKQNNKSWENLTKKDILELEVILVSKRKLRAFYNNQKKSHVFGKHKTIKQKILIENKAIRNANNKNFSETLYYRENFSKYDEAKNKTIKYRDIYEHNFTKTNSLFERPINCIVPKTKLIELAKDGHYFVTKNGISKKRTFNHITCEKIH